MAKKIYINEVKSFPVYVYLTTPNPYNNKVKCNNITVTTNKQIIQTKTKLQKLKPIEDYLVIELITDANRNDVPDETI